MEGTNIRLCKGDQIRQKNDPIFNTSALPNVANSSLGCSRANLQLRNHRRFFLHRPVFLFSDDFQHVARHEAALLSTRHPDEAASLALAAHADLTKKRIQFKTLKMSKMQTHTAIQPKNKSTLTQWQKQFTLTRT